jgi:hypothetical protein
MQKIAATVGGCRRLWCLAPRAAGGAGVTRTSVAMHQIVRVRVRLSTAASQ